MVLAAKTLQGIIFTTARILLMVTTSKIVKIADTVARYRVIVMRMIATMHSRHRNFYTTLLHRTVTIFCVAKGVWLSRVTSHIAITVLVAKIALDAWGSSSINIASSINSIPKANTVRFAAALWNT